MPLHEQIKTVYGDYSEYSIRMKPNLNRILNYVQVLSSVALHLQCL